MKILLSFLLYCFTLQVGAYVEQVRPYEVVSYKPDKNLKAGTCKISGTIVQADGCALKNVMIITANGMNYLTNAKGEFEFIAPCQSQRLNLSKEGFKDVTIETDIMLFDSNYPFDDRHHVVFKIKFSPLTQTVKVPDQNTYSRIISDIAEPGVPENLCKVSGTVTYKMNALKNVIIQTTDLISLKTDQDGQFTFFVDTSVSTLRFHYPGMDDLNFKYEFKGEHHLKLEITFPSPIILPPENMIVYKPVIYAYAPQETKIDFHLLSKGKLTFSYPQLQENSWHVTTTGDGMLRDVGGRKVPYLFWESEAAAGLTFSKTGDSFSGWVIKTDTVVSFFEHQLDNLGLNAREKTDFITFWGPRLQREEFAFIQFWLDADYDRIATLDISPKPDQLRRIHLLFELSSSFPEKLKPTAQHFAPFTRDGFTVVEWGGTELNDIHQHL